MPHVRENPTYCPWNPEEQDNYILACFEKLKHFRKNRSSVLLDYTVNHYSETEENLFLTRLYDEGCYQNKLRVDFDDFKNAILKRPGRLYSQNYYWHGNDYFWYERHGVSYRQKMKYQKRDSHNKKKLSEDETNYRDWRDKKGFERDHSKGKHWWHGSSAKKFAKGESNRWNRRKEKQAIQNEKYDIFPTLQEIHDCWMWD